MASTSAIGGRLGVRFELGEFGGGRRLDVERVADFVLDVGEAALGGLAALLGAGRLGARFAHRFERRARGLVGVGEAGLGLRERVGRRAARRGRGFDLADQGLTLGREALRRAFELSALGACLGAALLDGRDMRCGVVLAFVPVLALGRDRLQAAIGQLGLARDRLFLDPHLGQRLALAGDDVVDRRELFLELGGGGQVRRARPGSDRAPRPLRRGRY